MNLSVVSLTQNLIARRSITPDDAGCLVLIEKILTGMTAGLDVKFRTRFLSPSKAANLYAVWGCGPGGILIVGHTDVVPTDAQQWTFDPFVPTVRDGKLHGRGASDMKGPLAAIIVALSRLIEDADPTKSRIGLLLTSDEEMAQYGGTEAALSILRAEKEPPFDMAIIAEPSANLVLGDRIKIGARGRQILHVTLSGVSGHVGNCDPKQEAVSVAFGIGAAICRLAFTQVGQAFGRTMAHPTFVTGGDQAAISSVPELCRLAFDIRHTPEWHQERLRAEVEEALTMLQPECEVDLRWETIAKPWLSQPGPLFEVVDTVLTRRYGRAPEHSTDGGTSDGRYLKDFAPQALELGPPNGANNIHGADEFIRLDELTELVELYFELLKELLPRETYPKQTGNR